MEKISRLACSCGETVEITPGADVAKCLGCGRIWKQADWPQHQRLDAVDSEFSRNPKIFPKTLPVTQMFSQEEILEIKEASGPEQRNRRPQEHQEPREEVELLEIREPKASERRTRKRELPATQMFTMNELDEIRKASISDRKKEEK